MSSYTAALKARLSGFEAGQDLGYRRGRADERERCLLILRGLRLRAIEYGQGDAVTSWLDAAEEHIAWPAVEE